MSGTTIPQEFSRYPLLWLATCFACGIVAGYLFKIGSSSSVIATLLLVLPAMVLRGRSSYLILLAFVPLGSFCYALEREGLAPNRIRRIYDEERIRSGEPVELEGVLIRFPETTFDGSFLLLQAERLRFRNSDLEVSGNVRLFIPPEEDSDSDNVYDPGLRYGTRVRVYCKLDREERFQNPGVASRIELLDQQRIDATASLKSTLLLERLGDESVFLPVLWIYAQRQRLTSEFRQRFSAPTAGVMIASLLGNQHFLDRRTSDLFREGGTFHVLVISGLHITFIGGLVVWLVSFVIRRRTLQFGIAVTFLWAYTMAVGAEVPVVRASIMFTVLLFSRVIHREGSQLNALGLCVLLLLVWRPADLFSASFQLTTISVIAIIGCSFPLIEKLRAIGRWMPSAQTALPPVTSARVRRFCELLYWNGHDWEIENRRQIWSANLFKSPLVTRRVFPNLQSVVAYVFEGILVSIIVQAWMLPLLVIYFHRISPASIILNLWVGALLTLESFSAVFAVLIAGVSDGLALPLMGLTEILNALMLWAPAWFSESGFAGFRVPVYSGLFESVYWLFAIAVVGTAASLFRWDPFDYVRNQRWRPRVTFASLGASIAFGVIIALHPFSEPEADGRLKIEFLDVGQGDSALVTFPNGVTMLVDGGGEISFSDPGEDAFEPDRRRIGESVVSEFLWEKGYSHIDYVVATHSDADHIQGLVDVAQNFDIGLVVFGDFAVGDPDFDALLTVVERKRIQYDQFTAGRVLTIAGVRVEILHPPMETSHGSSNNLSVVMKLIYGSRSFLLTGDIERETEAVLTSHPSIDLAADVMKVPHHGSRTSSTEEFIGRVRPETAVISVGRRSRFGHPHPEVVERLETSQAKILKTGDKGTITVSTNRKDVDIRTFRP